ncbi:hypothetical protein BUE76_04380 [Cnuella takakiae]|nr:hypothetical protein BUE76_04380 [Cnuella takakiae]
MPGNCIVLLPDAPVFTIVAATNDYYKTSGRTAEELIGKGVFEAFPAPPQDPGHAGMQQLHTSLNNVIRQKIPDRMPMIRYDIVNADGSFDERYWLVVTKPVLGGNEEVLYIIHTVEEMTSQLKAEQSASRIKSLEQSYDLFIQAPVAIGIARGSEYIIELANDNLLESWALSAADVLGKPFYEVVPDPDKSAFRQLLDQVFRSGKPHFVYEHPVRLMRNGKEELRYFDFVYKPFYEDGSAVPAGIFTVGHNVTEQVVARKKVAESETKLKAVVEQTPAPTLVLQGDDFIIENINGPMLEMIGRGTEVVGQPLLAVMPELEGQYTWQQMQQVYRKGIHFDLNEVLVPHQRTGVMKDYYYNVAYRPLKEDGRITGVIQSAIDVTDQVLTGRKTEESEAKLRSILNSAPTAIGDFVGPDLILENPNQLMIEVMAAGPDVEGKSFRKLLSGLVEEEQKFLDLIDTVRSTGEPFEAQEVPVFFKASNKNRYFNISFIPLFDENGAVYAVLDVSVDVTEQVLVRRKLEESEGRFRLLADASPNLIWMLNPDGSYGYVNKTTLHFLGVTQEQIAAVGWQPFQHPKELEPTTKALQKAIQNQEPYQMEHRLRYHDGTYRWMLSQAIPVYDANGNVFAYVGSSIDITENKNNRQELITALEQARLSKDAAELGTFDMDLERGTLHWDDRCRTLFGISHHGPVTYEKDFACGLHPDDRERILKVIEQLFIKSISNGEYDVEYRTVGAEDGVIRWVRAKGKVYFDTQDKPVRFIGSVLDISEKVMDIQRIEHLVEERTREVAQANEKLLQTNKELHRSNQNLEEFAHAASHDLKEPIRKIHFFTHQLRAQLGDRLTDSEVRSFSRIENATKRMGNLIDDLLLYSHVSQRPHETEAVDLNEKVQRVLEDLDLDIEEKDATIIAGKLPVVQGYRRQLQQLFQNLISNALKYSKADEPPRIEITAAIIEQAGKSYHLLSVKDNGIGFDPAYADKIFQMFARLHGKAEYSGTGVGLSIVKKVVENHDGFIEVASEVGVGSTFKIFLPV